MKTSERIRELMIEKGLTAYHLAKETGISQATLSRILNKESKPNTNTLKILSKYFGKNEKWILTGRGDNSGINNVSIRGDGNNNISGAGNVNIKADSDAKPRTDIVRELSAQLAEKDRQMGKLQDQIGQLLAQQAALIAKLTE